MTVGATLCAMSGIDETAETRKLAGRIVRDEMFRRGLSYERAAEKMTISKARLSDVTAGRPGIGEGTLRRIEGVLLMPTSYLSYVIAGDIERVRALPSDTESPGAGLREDIRRLTLHELEQIEVGKEPGESPPAPRSRKRASG